MNITSARNVSEFVHVLAKDSEGRPTHLLVPGHEGRKYSVTLKRNGGLSAHCFQIVSSTSASCKGSSHCICYHVLAACIVSASEQGKELSWCESQADAERLSNIEGKVFTVRSSQSGEMAYGVVRELNDGGKVELDLTSDGSEMAFIGPSGLLKFELVELAIKQAGDKRQWYSGESMWIAEDAYLKNDGYRVRLYRSDKSGKYPKVTRLATIFWLDPGNVELGWQRYTEAQQAFDELYPDRDSALPVQRTRGRNKLFKT